MSSITYTYIQLQRAYLEDTVINTASVSSVTLPDWENLIANDVQRLLRYTGKLYVADVS